MHVNLLVRLASFLVILVGSTAASQAVPVEYVKICSFYSVPDFYYVPGTDTCLNALTGETKRETADGTVTDQSPLAARISALESPLCDGCFAVVDKTGAVLFGSQVQGTTKNQDGVVRVVFNKNVDTCALNATIGDDKSQIPGFITVDLKHPGSRTVIVRTFSTGGILVDRGFHLSITCQTGPSG